MPRYSSDHVPTYRLHKQSGQAIVTIGGRDSLLGTHDSAESRERYNARISEWFAARRPAGFQPVAPAEVAVAPLTIDELIVAWLAHARTYYVDVTGATTRELRNFDDANRFSCSIMSRGVGRAGQ